ncbi:metallophosphoesterase [Candidatus Woesearchaeota archaeon]|nr:metallophosphoesterase [Candidatus Woesearchaeota archaeon]
MEISKDIEIVSTALWFKKEETIIINDLHLGYEEALQHKGVLVPKFQLQEILSLLEKILEKTNAKKIIINGDLKHEFGKVLRQEWKEVLQFFDFLQKKGKEIIIIQGNHDPAIAPLAGKRGIIIVKEILLNDTLIIHGDELVKTDAKRIIIGHEHPAITLREGSKWEKYKCFLKGKWYQKNSFSGTSGKGKLFQKKEKELIAVPSFNPLLEGTDVLKEKLLSPFLNDTKRQKSRTGFLPLVSFEGHNKSDQKLFPSSDIRDFEVFVVGKEEGLYFGKVKNFIKEKD